MDIRMTHHKERGKIGLASLLHGWHCVFFNIFLAMNLWIYEEENFDENFFWKVSLPQDAEDSLANKTKNSQFKSKLIISSDSI